MAIGIKTRVWNLTGSLVTSVHVCRVHVLAVSVSVNTVGILYSFFETLMKLDMADSISKNLVYEPFLGMDCKENDKYVRVEKKEMCTSNIVFTF